MYTMYIIQSLPVKQQSASRHSVCLSSCQGVSTSHVLGASGHDLGLKAA